MSALDEALRYAAAGMLIFPVDAFKKPLTPHGFKDASSDPEVIAAWLEKWPHCEFAWALPADVVVVDVDRKNGKDGYRDLQDRAGCDPREVATPSASSPSGGLHLIYKASKPYKNAVAIDGTGIDVRALGGYVVLPLPGNGREWLNSPVTMSLSSRHLGRDDEDITVSPSMAKMTATASTSDRIERGTKARFWRSRPAWACLVRTWRASVCRLNPATWIR